MTDLRQIIPDWDKGPLDAFRALSSFDWRKMKVTMESLENVVYKEKVYQKMRNDPVFSSIKPWEEYDRSEQREVDFKRMKSLLVHTLITEESFLSNPYMVVNNTEIGGQLSWSVTIKRSLGLEYFIGNARGGKSTAYGELIEEIKNFRAFGALCITELAHGSNTKKLRTTAHYDAESREFIINTPDLEATKVWAGNLGQTATHAVVFAQLYTPDGVCHGLHSFFVPVRDPKTLLPYKGLTVGDMGAKLGLHGLDNGFMMLNNYRVPKSALISKNAEVTLDGRYINKIQNKSERMGITLGILSMGRIFILSQCITNANMALAISIRYSAMRKQFGPENSDSEYPVIDYQMQQHRLFPYLAATFVFKNFFNLFYRDSINFFIMMLYEKNNPIGPALGSEVHSISCISKAYFAWVVRDTIQQSRESCGGHGFLAAARFGALRGEHDANITYEGEANLITQQTSNHLLKLYNNRICPQKKSFKSPLGTTDYFDDMDEILTTQVKSDLTTNLDSLIASYRFLVCHLMKKSAQKFNQELQNSEPFDARNRSQVFYLRSLAVTFFECLLLERYQQLLQDQSVDQNIRCVLGKLGMLFGLWAFEKHMSLLYDCGHIRAGDNVLNKVQDEILRLCEALRDDAVALVDSFAPPDFLLNSALGYSDGNVYKHIWDSFVKSKDAFKRPDWYKEFTENKPNLTGTRDEFTQLEKSRL